jgi:hypothetical protein
VTRNWILLKVNGKVVGRFAWEETVGHKICTEYETFDKWSLGLLVVAKFEKSLLFLTARGGCILSTLLEEVCMYQGP